MLKFVHVLDTPHFRLCALSIHSTKFIPHSTRRDIVVLFCKHIKSSHLLQYNLSTVHNNICNEFYIYIFFASPKLESKSNDYVKIYMFIDIYHPNPYKYDPSPFF